MNLSFKELIRVQASFAGKGKKEAKGRSLYVSEWPAIFRVGENG